jgi:hypothetical protein
MIPLALKFLVVLIFFQTPKPNYDSLNDKLSTLPYWETLDIEPFVLLEPRY